MILLLQYSEIQVAQLYLSLEQFVDTNKLGYRRKRLNLI